MPRAQLTESLRAGRRALEGLGNCQLLEDYAWSETARAWVLKVRLTLDKPEMPELASTDWYILTPPTYPVGNIKIHPSIANGMAGSREHQALNRPPSAEAWQTGDICVRAKRWAALRGLFAEEPAGQDERLEWYVRRALEWIAAADQGGLTQAGDPFELPPVDAQVLDSVVAFGENRARLDHWLQHTAQHGTAHAHRVVSAIDRLLLHDFVSSRGETVKSPWRASVGETDATPCPYILLPETPLTLPWGAPRTWGDLRRACGRAGVGLDSTLRQIATRLRDGKEHSLLVGFPIPQVVGGPMQRMHWWALRLPVLSSGTRTARGFRPNESGWWQRDRVEPLGDAVPIRWLRTENWDQDLYAARGQLAPELRTSDILLVGAGSLGSAIAELLVRGGVERLIVMDDGLLELGNLVRHTATIADLDRPKAEFLASRLGNALPTAEVIPVVRSFPPDDADQEALVAGSSIVIDATAEDEALPRLGNYAWGSTERTFMSVSLGLNGKRLFLMIQKAASFPSAELEERLRPWMEHEREEYELEGNEYQQPAGRYHALFPARIDQVWRHAALAVQLLESAVAEASPTTSFRVFENHPDGSVSEVTQLR